MGHVKYVTAPNSSAMGEGGQRCIIQKITLLPDAIVDSEEARKWLKIVALIFLTLFLISQCADIGARKTIINQTKPDVLIEFFLHVG